jgi:hypothetical protein
MDLSNSALERRFDISRHAAMNQECVSPIACRSWAWRAPPAYASTQWLMNSITYPPPNCFAEP